MIYRVSQKKYVRLTSRDTDSITSISKIWLGLDRWDIKLNYYTIAVHFTSLLIELLTQELSASFWKSRNINQNQGKSYEKSLQFMMSNYILLGAFFWNTGWYFLRVLKVFDEPLGESNTERRVKISASISKEGT